VRRTGGAERPAAATVKAGLGAGGHPSRRWVTSYGRELACAGPVRGRSSRPASGRRYRRERAMVGRSCWCVLSRRVIAGQTRSWEYMLEFWIILDGFGLKGVGLE
jgi:hypothetical protein